MVFFELLTWLAFGVFLAVFKLYLPKQGPSRAAQIRTVLLGGGGGVVGGVAGRLLGGSAMMIGGFSVFALLFAGAVALALLAFESTVTGKPRAPGGEAPR